MYIILWQDQFTINKSLSVVYSKRVQYYSILLIKYEHFYNKTIAHV